MPSTMVVGFDGSPASRAAVDWAARRAQRFGSELRLVSSVPDDWGATTAPLSPETLDRATLILAAERDRIAALLPASTIHISVRRGEPVAVLGELSREAGMVVVGTDKPADARGEGFGGVGLQLVTRSACTVAIIPGTAIRGAGVVVGIDGSAESDRALRVAAGEAEASGQVLTMVHATAPAGPGRPQESQEPPGTAAAAVAGERLLNAAVAAVNARHPRVDVQHVLDLRHSPAEALASAARGAALLVVGSRGRESVKHMRPGAIGSVVLTHIDCPMLVTTGPAGRA